MRHITEIGLNLIKRFEGFSPTVYICPAGYPTVGYGHLVRPEERAQFRDGVTVVWAGELLKHDIRIAEASVVRLVTTPLTDGQRSSAPRCAAL
jgi:lysozyme